MAAVMRALKSEGGIERWRLGLLEEAGVILRTGFRVMLVDGMLRSVGGVLRVRLP